MTRVNIQCASKFPFVRAVPVLAQEVKQVTMLTNPVITVEGNKATAHVIWTGVMNEGVGKAPSLYEQGREDSELRKVTCKPRDRC
jgi:hypothetical protein